MGIKPRPETALEGQCVAGTAGWIPARAALGRNDESLCLIARLGSYWLAFGNLSGHTGTCELFDPDRGGFELRRAGLWIYGIDSLS